MKLINAETISGYIKREINPYGRPFKGSVYEFGLKLMKYLENASADYDVDKVVELLEKQPCDTEIFEETPTRISGVFSYDLKTHKMVELADAIQIVRDGGKNDN